MARVVSRCVMPNTMEANRANTTTALKWLRCSVIELPQRGGSGLTTDDGWLMAASLFFPDRDVVGVGDRNEVQQSGDDHEFCSVVGGGEGDGALAPVLRERDDV